MNDAIFLIDADQNKFIGKKMIKHEQKWKSRSGKEMDKQIIKSWYKLWTK